MTKLPSRTRKLYWQIRQDTVSIHYRASLIFDYWGNSEKRNILKQSSPLLFDRLISNDAFDSLVLDFMRLLDPLKTSGHENASIHKLIQEVTLLNPQLAKRLEARRKRMAKKLSSLKRWRMKWAAHRDYKMMLIMQTTSQAKRRVKFNRNKVEAALAELDSLLNLFESAFQDINFAPRNADEASRRIFGVTDYSSFHLKDEMEQLIKRLI